jgi:hypothetical protein
VSVTQTAPHICACAVCSQDRASGSEAMCMFWGHIRTCSLSPGSQVDAYKAVIISNGPGHEGSRMMLTELSVNNPIVIRVPLVTKNYR